MSEGEIIIVASGETLSGVNYRSGEVITVRSGGVLADVTLEKEAGSLCLESGSTVTGTLRTAVPVTAAGAVTGSNAALNLDISGNKEEDGLLWNDITLISPKSVSVTVSPDQDKGTYRLAGNAADFSSVITVYSSSGATLGTLSLADPVLDFDITRYTLALNDANELTVSVSSNITDDNYYVFLYKNNQLVVPLEEGYHLSLSGDGEYDHMVVIDQGLAGDVNLKSGGLITVYNGGYAVGITQEINGKLRFDYNEGDTSLMTGVNPYGTFLVQDNHLDNVYGEYVTLTGKVYVDDYHSIGVFTSIDGVDITGIFVSQGERADFKQGTVIHGSTMSGNNLRYFENTLTTDSDISYGNIYGGTFSGVTAGYFSFEGGISYVGDSELTNGGCLAYGCMVELTGTLTVRDTISLGWGNGYIDANGNTIIMDYTHRDITDEAMLPGGYVSEDAVYRVDLKVDQPIGTYQLLSSTIGAGRSKYSFTIHTDEGDLVTLTETNLTYDNGCYTYTIDASNTIALTIDISPNADETFNVLLWQADGIFLHAADFSSVTLSESENTQMLVRRNGFAGDITLTKGGLLRVDADGYAVGITHLNDAALRFNYTAGDSTIISGVNEYGTFLVQDDFLMNVIGENVDLRGKLSVQDYHSTGVFTAQGGAAFSGIFHSGKSAYLYDGSTFLNAYISGESIYFCDGVSVTDSTVTYANFRDGAITDLDESVSGKGGTYTNVVVHDGYFYRGTFKDCVFLGGTLDNNAVIELAGTLTVKGNINAYWNSCINANGNLVILDYTDRSVTSGAIIGQTHVSEDVVFQIKMTETQALGTYTILSDSGMFQDVFDLVIDGDTVGRLEQSHTVIDYGNYVYTMVHDIEKQLINLTIEVSENADETFNVMCYNAAGEITHAPEMSGIVVDGTTCAKVIVRNGGLAENMHVDNGLADVRTGAIVYGITQESNGKLRFNYTAGDTTLITGINRYGVFFVQDDYLLNVSGENVTVTGEVVVEDYHSNGTFRADGATITGAYYGDGTFVDGIVRDAVVTGTGTVGGDAVVTGSTFGSANFYNGFYQAVLVTGSANVSGGTYSDVTFLGNLSVNGRIVLDDKLTIAGTAYCTEDYYVNGAIDSFGYEVNLDLTNRSTISDAMININRVYNAQLTVTVYADQTIGTYLLGSTAGNIGQGDAEGYWDIDTNTWLYKGAIQGDLDGVITVRSDQGVTLANCTVNGDTEYFGRYNYTVYTDEEDKLRLRIGWNNRGDMTYSPDGYDNDTMAKAVAISGTGTGSLGGLTVDTAEDVDWYQFSLETPGHKASYIGIDFKQWAGDLDIELYDADGNRLDYARSVTDNERISLTGYSTGTYYLKVYGDSGNTNAYSVVWNLPVSPKLADPYEKGNTALTNTYLGKITEDKNISAAIGSEGDIDYYSFITTRKGITSDTVTLTFNDEYGDLDLYLYDANGLVVLAKSVQSGTSVESISLKGLYAGLYVVKVAAKNGYSLADYDLSFSIRSTEVNPDKYENNNSLLRATRLYTLNGAGTLENLSVHSDSDVDYYRFSILEKGSADDFITLSCEASLGDLDIEILDKKGKVVAYSRTAENEDTVSLKGLVIGEYYIRVSGYNNVANNYTLSWNVTNSALIPSDTYEGNEPIAIREDQTIKGLSIAKTRKDDETREDTFKITLEYDAWKRSKIILSDYRSDWEDGMAYTLKDAAGNVLLQGKGSEISLAGLKKGDYYLTVDTPNEDEYSEYTFIAQSLPDSDTQTDNTWSIFIYIAGDNNLEGAYLTELLYMQRAILPEDVEVYVLMDRSEEYAVGERNWTDTRVGKIVHSNGGAVAVQWMYFDGENTSEYVSSQTLDNRQEWDTGDVDTLEAFLNWGMKTAPAENYALIMKDHGTSLGYNCSDEESGSIMSIGAISDLLSDEKYDRLSVVAFDQCLMGSDVVVTTMDGNVDYVVASEAVGYTPNMLVMYKVLLNSLETDMTPQELSQKIVKACNCSGTCDLTLSSFHTGDSTLTAALEQFGALASQFTRTDWITLCKCYGNSYNYGDSICAFSDLRNILDLVLSYSATISETLYDAASSLYQVVSEQVIDSTMITPATYGTGLAVFNPVLSDPAMSNYSYGGDSSLDYYATAIGKTSWGNFAYTLGKLAEDYAPYIVDDSAHLTFTSFSYMFLDNEVKVTYDLGAFSGNGATYEGLYMDKDAYFMVSMLQEGVEGDAIQIIADNPDAEITITLVQAIDMLLDDAVYQTRRVSENGILSLDGIDPENAGAFEDYKLIITSTEETTYTMKFLGNWSSGVDFFDYSRTGSIDSAAEGNNSIDKATELPSGNYAGLLTYQGDKDYYKIKSIYANTLDITVKGEGLTVQEYDAQGTLIQNAVYEDGVYTIEVTQDNYLLVEGSADISQNNVNSYMLCISDVVQTYLKATLDVTLPEKPLVTAEENDTSVTLTASFEEDCKGFYSQDMQIWQEYTAPVVVTANGVYYFKAVDTAAFLESSYTSYEVNTIDSIPPTVSNIMVSTKEPTNQNIIVTAEFADETCLKSSLYRIGQDAEWIVYTDGVTVTENATVQLKAVDAAGNETIESVEVTNIDKIAPEAPSVTASTAKATNQNVTVEAAFSADSIVKQYSLDGETWQDYQAVVMESNGMVYFRGRDEAGNWSAVTSYEVTNIDKVAPEAPSVTASTAKVTNQNVTVEAAFSNDSAVKQYSLDGDTWQDYQAVVMESNGMVYFRGRDEAGNWSAVTSYEVTNIDKIAPEAPSVTASTESITWKAVTITAVFSEDSTVREYSLDAILWIDYSDPIEVKENGTLFFRAFDEAGNQSSTVSYTVDNIEKRNLYVNSAWKGYAKGTVVEVEETTAIIGETAFSNLEDAEIERENGGTIVMIGTYSGNATIEGEEVRLTDAVITGTVYAGEATDTPEDKNVTISGTTATRALVGGNFDGVNQEDANQSCAAVTAVITGGSFAKGILAGEAKNSTIYANTTITVSESNTGNVTFGGMNLTAGTADAPNNVTINGDSAITLTDVTNTLYTNGGSLITHYGNEVRNGDITVSIDGGSFASVSGGSLIQSSKGVTEGKISSEINGKIAINISGNAVIDSVYAGSGALKASASVCSNVTGDVAVTIDVTEGVTIKKYIFAGGMAKSTIDGSATITIKGAGDGTDCLGAKIISGESSYAKGSTLYVSDEKSLVFNNFSGKVTGRVAYFDTITIDATSQVEFSATNSYLDEGLSWNISADKASNVSVNLTCSEAEEYYQYFSFAGSELNFNCAEIDNAGTEWTIFRLENDSVDYPTIGFDGTTVIINDDELFEADPDEDSVTAFEGDTYRLEYRIDENNIGTVVAFKLEEELESDKLELAKLA